MGGMDFAIATPTRKASEDALLKDAVTAFKARAQLATDALGGKGYKIVNLNLNSNGYPQPYMRTDDDESCQHGSRPARRKWKRAPARSA
jgi:predicted secreted protein